MRIAEAQRIAATVSDVYAENCGIERDELWHLVKLQEELGELSAAWLSASGRGRDRGKAAAELRTDVEHEVADLFAQLLLFVEREGIDLGAALMRKWGKYLPDEAVE